MTAQVLDGTIAVLWGSATREVNWVHLDPRHGKTSVARAYAGGYWVRELHPIPGVEKVAKDAAEAWAMLREGHDLSTWATHRLAPPNMQNIEPIGGAV